jgi:DNA polymerase-3 subunit epsilon
MGYINQYADIAHEDDIKSLLQTYEGNDYMLHLIHNYASKYPFKVLKPTAEHTAKETQEHYYMD